MAIRADAVSLDEEGLVSGRPAGTRRQQGAYYTPRALVDTTLDAVLPCLPEGRLRVIDPACGAGAFLVAARERFPRAQLIGAELSPGAAAQCRARVPSARIIVGDALRGALQPLLPPEGAERFELWVGNPPYNGTSPLLKNVRAYARVRRLPEGLELPSGTSLRDDFAFFLLLARARLLRTQGALAFITPSTLLDAFLYAPLRKALLEALELVEVRELGSGVFQGTRVRTSITVWRSRLAGTRPTRAIHRERAPPDKRHPVLRFSPPARFTPVEPDWILRPVPTGAARLDAEWRKAGELLTDLVPISLCGLKTRFDELLVDDDPARLLGRVRAFLRSEIDDLASFAAAHDLPPVLLPKLRKLRQALPAGSVARRACLRPFYRYGGERHRGTIPEDARVYCYLDRSLIPRGDHRLRGDYDPHAEHVKLIFNIRELPLTAALLTRPGCVHDHRHTRFAPLQVPARILERGLAAAHEDAPLGRLVPNLSMLGRRWAATVGGPRALFGRIVNFVNSAPVQEIWAPAFGAFRTLPIPPPETMAKLLGPELRRAP